MAPRFRRAMSAGLVSHTPAKEGAMPPLSRPIELLPIIPQHLTEARTLVFPLVPCIMVQQTDLLQATFAISLGPLLANPHMQVCFVLVPVAQETVGYAIVLLLVPPFMAVAPFLVLLGTGVPTSALIPLGLNVVPLLVQLFTFLSAKSKVPRVSGNALVPLARTPRVRTTTPVLRALQ